MAILSSALSHHRRRDDHQYPSRVEPPSPPNLSEAIKETILWLYNSKTRIAIDGSTQIVEQKKAQDLTQLPIYLLDRAKITVHCSATEDLSTTITYWV
jgi:hypothetical protein